MPQLEIRNDLLQKLKSRAQQEQLSTDEIIEKLLDDRLDWEQLHVFQRVVEQSPDSIVITDPQGTITYVNSRLTASTGYSYEEALGENPRILQSEHMSPEEYEQLWATITAGDEWHGEFLTKGKKGNLYWESAAIFPVFDESGNITNIAAVRKDITEQKRTQEALRQSEARFRALFERTNDAVFLFGLDLVHREVNQQAADMLGYTIGEIVGSPIIDFIMPEEHGEAHSRGDQLRVGEKLPVYERKFRHKDGSVVYGEVNVALVYDEHGDPTHYHSIVRNITERKRAEEILRESEARFRTLVSNAPIAILIVNHHGEIVMANRKAESMFGYQPETLSGIPLEHLVPHELRDKHRDFVRRFFENPHNRLPSMALDVQTYGQRSDGVRFPVEVTLGFTERQSRRIALAFVTDITQRKALEKKDLALNLEQERHKILASFISDATHEFRTPLTIIQTSLYLLDKATTREKLERAQQNIDLGVRSLIRLVDALTTLSRLDSIQSYPLLPVNLHALLRELWLEFQEARKERQVDMQLELQAALPTVLGNFDDLALAFWHILDNAIKYSHPGGIVSVRCAESEGDHILVQVQDSGIGMSDETIRHAFERFYREDKAHTTRGLGLGLPITKQVIELHRGHIRCTSAEGMGTEFAILLPGISHNTDLGTQV